MEHIPGVELESISDSFSAGAKILISTQLQPISTQIRPLVPPPEFIGGDCGGIIPDPLFGTVDPDPKLNRHFGTEEIEAAMRKLK